MLLLLLLLLWATSIKSKLPSPAELLLERQIQDNLPTRIQSNHNSDELIFRLQERQACQKFYHYQHATALPSLVPGQNIAIQNPKTLEWKPVMLLNKLKGAPQS